MKRTITALLLVSVTALTLSACAQTDGIESGSDNTPAHHYTFWQELPDDQRVMCVWAQADIRSGGLSCNWNDIQAQP